MAVPRLRAAKFDEQMTLVEHLDELRNRIIVSVAVLITAGVIRGIEEVRPWPGLHAAVSDLSGWRGLWDTTYGLLLLAKIGLVLPLLALGAYNNRFAVPRLRPGWR